MELGEPVTIGLDYVDTAPFVPATNEILYPREVRMW